MDANCCDKFAHYTGCGCCINTSKYQQIELAEVVQNRRCTDLPCCLLLIVCIVIQIYIFISASENGANPSLLIHGTDYNGTLCDENNLNGPYTVWPSLSNFDIRLCTHSCNTFTNNPTNKLMIDIYESSPFLNAYCIPSISSKSDHIYSNFDKLSTNFQRSLANLYITKWLILIISFVAIILSFIYLKLISFLSKILIKFTVFMVTISGILFSCLLFQNGYTDYHIPETSHIGLIEMVIASVIILILICLFLAFVFSRKQIDLVIDLLNEAHHALYDMKLTLIFPIWMSFVGILYIAYWTIEALYIYSVQTYTIKTMPGIFLINDLYPNTYKDAGFNFDAMGNEFIWHIFLLFYSVEVIIYFSFTVLCGVFCDWYFSEWMNESKKYKQRGDNVARLSESPILESLWRVTRYHLGSLAFGAVIITVIRMIEGIFTYIRRKTNDAQNPVTKCLFCMISCCLKCCECVFERINKNGFIFMAIYGTPFCYSSYSALQIILKNMGKTILMTGISKYTEQFGRFVVSLLNTGIALLVMKYYGYYADNLESFLFPAVVIFVVTYMISALFMMVFDTAVQSIFLCFLVDEAVNGEPKFATEEMKDLVYSAVSIVNRKNEDNDGNVQTYTQV